jgi:hypothetical protein
MPSQLRWEIYNIFNHTNFRDIDAAATYGLVVTNPAEALLLVHYRTCAPLLSSKQILVSVRYRCARTPRVMQASIRFNF